MQVVWSAYGRLVKERWMWLRVGRLFFFLGSELDSVLLLAFFAGRGLRDFGRSSCLYEGSGRFG